MPDDIDTINGRIDLMLEKYRKEKNELLASWYLTLADKEVGKLLKLTQ